MHDPNFTEIEIDECFGCDTTTRVAPICKECWTSVQKEHVAQKEEIARLRALLAKARESCLSAVDGQHPCEVGEESCPWEDDHRLLDEIDAALAATRVRE